MSKILKTASAVAVAMSTLAALSVTDVGLAFYQDADVTAETEVLAVVDEDSADDLSESALLSEQAESAQDQAEQTTDDSDIAPVSEQAEVLADEPSVEEIQPAAASLRELVSWQDVPAQLDAEMQCLAGTVYFESKGESLEGQLAVARVVIARALSSRFPGSYCGVVYQRKQFSFVRSGRMPRINTASRAWRNARAIAQIAHDNAWQSKAEGALFFHARYVNPRWRLTRMTQIDNHIFYR